MLPRHGREADGRRGHAPAGLPGAQGSCDHLARRAAALRAAAARPADVLQLVELRDCSRSPAR
eukprot:11719770-Alexandrium_andersonii.AAC.1